MTTKRQELETLLRKGKWTAAQLRKELGWKSNFLGVYLANTRGIVKEGTRHSYVYSLPPEQNVA